MLKKRLWLGVCVSALAALAVAVYGQSQKGGTSSQPQSQSGDKKKGASALKARAESGDPDKIICSTVRRTQPQAAGGIPGSDSLKIFLSAASCQTNGGRCLCGKRA
jgi:hypothetical protein